MKTIGEKIKYYRQKNNMTQEKLASCLNVTFQTVSKWETGVSSPDLSLIVPLTKLFRISADELLGLYDEETDKRYEELKEAYSNTYKTEDFAERQRICELAVAEYPGDMKWLSDLAWVVSNRSFEYEDNETYIAQQEKAIKLFEAVIKNCSDEILKGEAIIGITQLLGWRGRKDEARKYVEMLPERTGVTREQVLENVLEGEELVEFKQKRILDNIHGALRGLSLLPEESTDAMRALVQAMFPDGDYMCHYLTMYYAVQRQINHRVKLGVLEETIPALLAEMKGYAEKYTEILHKKPGVYRYTTPWFDHIEEDTRDWIGCEAETLLQDFAKYLEHPYFEKMREQFV